MRKLRVLELVHDVLVPPAGAELLGWEETWTYQMELDVQTTLRKLGHEVEVLGVEGDLRPLGERIAAWRPHIVFNVLTDFHDVVAYESHVVAYLELLKQPYTGCNARGIMLANDKALSKKILDWHDIPVPAFTVFAPGTKKPRLPAHLSYPVIVKSATQHGSEGISQASVVTSDQQLEKRVAFMHEKVGGDVIAEQYIAGPELTVSVLGNERPEALPVWELWFDNLPKGNYAIATEQVKWNVDYAQGIGIAGGPARELSPKQRRRIQGIARDAFKALGLSGYARVDFRMDQHGDVYVIEANVNPDLTTLEDFPEAAKAAGYDYPRLLQRVLSLGLAYRPAWKIG